MSIQSTAREFLERANHEVKRYGADRWVFLRELVQNSRDARATRIQFTLTYEDGWVILTCLDNGIGMTSEELSSYLLCLYASNKQYANADVGYFGVGFWSVLLFEPELIRVTTRSENDKVHGTEIWPNTFELKAYQGLLEGRGTRISLYKRMTHDETLPELVRQRLMYYAQFVRPRQGVSGLVLEFAGRQINGPMTAHMTFGKPFATRDFDGVIGFGPKPFVRLYKGGILVRDLTTLKQIIPSRQSTFSNKFPGLHPTVIANIDGIKVLLDRQKLYEDDLLHHFVSFTETTLNRLSLELIKYVFPLDLRNRCLLALSKLRLQYLWLGLGAILLISLGAVALRPTSRTLPMRPTAVEQARSLDFLMRPWDPSLIDPPTPQISRWDISYEGDSLQLFRVRTFDEFDPEIGLRVAPVEIVGDYPDLRIPPGKIFKVRMGIRRVGQPQILPLPPNHGLFKDSVRIDGHPQKVLRTQFDEPLILPDRTGDLTYESSAHPDQTLPPNYAPVEWPSFFEQVLEEARSKTSVAERIQFLTEFCRTKLSYSRDVGLANSFSAGDDSWLARIARTRAGDCDVLNGTLVMLLREVGVPALLCGGLVGEAGVIHSDLHAWAYYYSDGWHALDMTPARNAATVPQTTPTTSQTGPIGPNRPYPKAQRPITIWGIGLISASLIALLVLWLRKSKTPQLDPKQLDRCLEDLIQSHLSSPDMVDPLQLRYRPAIALLGGKRISLHQLNHLARQGPILAGSAHLPVLDQLESTPPIIDLAGPGTATLLRHFPMLINIAHLEVLLRKESLPSYLQYVETKIRAFDPEFRLHLIEGREFLEVTLSLKNRNLGSRHLFLGTSHRLYRKLTALQGQHPLLVTHALVSHVTFFRNSAGALLKRMAEDHFHD